ncbi:MAG: acylglycerol kinase family protein [Lewinellaceae bacterium]|nr:acylglycerol kinase family protein [Lewinellaceae bacterium]
MLDGIERHLDHRKFIYGIWHTEKRGHAIELTQKAIAEQYDIVVAVGGDGSVNEVARCAVAYQGATRCNPCRLRKRTGHAPWLWAQHQQGD